MRSVPQDQMSFGNEWVTGLAQVARGEYRNREWNEITWPFVWCDQEKKWYVARRRLAVETLGIRQQSLEERLSSDPIVSKGIRSLLIPSAGGAQPTACFPFDALPYVLQGIELNAPGLNPEIIPHLTYLKGLTHDILRDVLIYGKMPEVLKERQQAADIDRVSNIEQGIAELTSIVRDLVVRDRTRELTISELLENTRVIRAGYPGVWLKETRVPERIDGVNYTVIDRSIRHPGHPDWVYSSFGEVSDTVILDEVVRKLLMTSRYNGAKHGGNWTPWYAHYSDRRKTVQDIYHDFLLGAGCERVSNRIDVFWVPQRILNDSRCIPEYIRMNELKQYIDEHRLFQMPMEVSL